MATPPQVNKIYKIALTADWNKAVAEKSLFIGGALDIQDGFFHLSTAEQIPGTLNLFYKGKGANGALTLVEVDLKAYEAFLKETDEEGCVQWEHPPIEGDLRLFPHGYGKKNHGALPAVVDGVVVLRAEVIQEDQENLGSYKTYL